MGKYSPNHDFRACFFEYFDQNSVEVLKLGGRSVPHFKVLLCHTYLRLLLANKKFPEKMPLVTFFHTYVDNLNPENEKNRVSPFGEKPILSFLLT